MIRLGISKEKSTRILSLNSPKGSWKGHRGLKPPGWRFPKDKMMGIPIRIRSNPFLEQPERVMERIQWEETPRLGVSEGIRLRTGSNPFLGRPERVMERIPR
jgi:hypothetical protein